MILTMTVPPEAPISEPMVIVQATSAKRASGAEYVVKACGEVEHPHKSGWANSLYPALGLSQLLKTKYEVLEPLTKLEVAPAHGQLMKVGYYKHDYTRGQKERITTKVYANPDGSLPLVPPDTDTVKHIKPAGEEYDYVATPGFYGKDRAVFSVEYKGTRYRIDLEVRVSDFVPQASEGIGCPPPTMIRVVPQRSDTVPVNLLAQQPGR